jgi:hypothetical protein
MLLLAACVEESTPPPETQLSTAHLVQSICATPGALPFEAACGPTTPATPGALPYRRLDWSGVQAVDAVLLPSGEVAHTFDFGDGQRAFSRLDRGQGDGGDLLRITNRVVSITQTEDGGAGRQWWRDNECHVGDGWLLYRGTPTDQWTTSDDQLAQAFDDRSCPRTFSRVHTRWRRVSYPMPWRDNLGASGTLTLDAILSEHYAGGPPDQADHMERFLFARGLGKVMWERWEHAGRTHRVPAELAQAIMAMDGDGRCPIPADAPAPGWVRADCRVWMHFDRQGGQSMPWP